MRKNNIPQTLDGATVISATKAEINFGIAETFACDNVEIAALAVAQYENSMEFYLFACDAEWNVVGDLAYDTIGKAKQDAERYYKTGLLEWVEIDR